MNVAAKSRMTVTELLDRLEKQYGEQEAGWPTDPYLFLIWWHCGYPASDKACAKGWDSLRKHVGIELEQILRAPTSKLTEALRPGGMVPELRAIRLKEIAARIKDEFSGDLRAALVGPMTKVRGTLKKFPNIADPGADRILVFAGIAAVAAIPSNCPHVLVRLLRGQERENYGVTYREAQESVEAEILPQFDARIRTYLLLKRHGQEICKAKPKCEQCILQAVCAYFSGKRRGR